MKNQAIQKLLPILAPPITSYQQIALPLAVAMQNPTAENWLYSNYIQVFCVNRRHYLASGNRDNALHYSFYNPEITLLEPADHICIEGREQLYLFKNPDFVKEAIGAGWYLYTDADMFYIDGSNGFGQAHYPHDLLIYGYDEENVYLHMYGESKLTSHRVSYGSFLKGYYSECCDEDTYRDRAILFRPNGKDCAANLGRIRWHMHDYLDGTETFARENPNIFNPHSLTMNGIDTYEEFVELLDYAMENEEKDLRRTDLYCLYEHKKLMLDRVVYLRGKGLLSASDRLLEELGSVKGLSQTLMLLGLKVNALRDSEKKDTALMSMKEKLKDLKGREEAAWYRYIDENREVLG